MSWDEGFAQRYEEWSAKMTEDIPFYVRLAEQTDGPIVELAVGNGRVAIPIARKTGRKVIGIDSSPAMIEQGVKRAAEADVDVEFVLGDIRDFELEEQAGLIYCPFRSLLHLPAWEDRRRTFERVSRSLKHNGRFAWNAFAFDHKLAAQLDGKQLQDPVPHELSYSVGDNRIDIKIKGGGVSSLWWATLNEWRGLIDTADLEIEALFGGFSGEPFDDVSREYVFITRKPSTDG